MAHPLPTTLTRFHLNNEELASGQTLTTNNLYMIQNLIADAAEEKLALKYDALNPIEFAQREAELQGQIGILKYIVEMASQQNPSINISTSQG